MFAFCFLWTSTDCKAHCTLECACVRDIHEKFFTVSSVNELFESIDNHTIIACIQETHFNIKKLLAYLLQALMPPIRELLMALAMECCVSESAPTMGLLHRRHWRGGRRASAAVSRARGRPIRDHWLTTTFLGTRRRNPVAERVRNKLSFCRLL